jgi:hypothetical protein
MAFAVRAARRLGAEPSAVKYYAKLSDPALRSRIRAMRLDERSVKRAAHLLALQVLRGPIAPISKMAVRDVVSAHVAREISTLGLQEGVATGPRQRGRFLAMFSELVVREYLQVRRRRHVTHASPHEGGCIPRSAVAEFASTYLPATFLSRALRRSGLLEELGMMKIKMDVREIDEGFLVTAPPVVGLSMWHRDPDRIARHLPGRAARLLKSNHNRDATVRVAVPEGMSPGDAILQPGAHLVAENQDSRALNN